MRLPHAGTGADSSYSNVITRCVGANSDVMPDIYVGCEARGRVLTGVRWFDGNAGRLPAGGAALARRMPQDEVDH